MKIEIDTGKIVDTVVSEALEREIDGKTIKQWMAEIAKYQWISVKDRLPERKSVDYLVATRIKTDGTRGFNIAWINGNDGAWSSNDEWICDGREVVTHWMPLPEPPKENS